MWKEIFNHLATDATDAELLNLSLINKRCYSLVCQVYLSKLPAETELPVFNENLNPKQFYFFNKSRQRLTPKKRTQTLMHLPRGFEVKTKYAPWLDHNILRHPQNFWLFIGSIFRNPEWILPTVLKSTAVMSFSTDKVSKRQLFKYVNWCSVSNSDLTSILLQQL